MAKFDVKIRFNHLRKNLKFKMGEWADRLLIGLSIIMILGIIYFLGDAFFGLVGDIYRFLDGFIWAFFAGIIAFFLSITLSGLIIYITLISLAFAFVALTTIAVAIFGDGTK